VETQPDLLIAAREAYERAAWTPAHELLSRADVEGSLAAEDLERLAVAASTTGSSRRSRAPTAPTGPTATAPARCARPSGSGST
jgi:hypothetical protein